MVKKIMAIGVGAFMLCVMNTVTVSACTATSGCYATTTRVVCGAVQSMPYGSHVVTEPNGYQAYCSVTQVAGPHSIYCTGCNAFLRQENRTCSIIHTNQHCFSQYNLCQY